MRTENKETLYKLFDILALPNRWF